MLPGESPAQVLEELRRVAAQTGVEVEIRELLARPPLRCDPGSMIATAAREAILEVEGAPAEETGVAYWMDAAIFAEAGIPTVDYGLTGAGAHAAVEWVDFASVVQCARVLENAARRFFAGA